MTVQIVKGCLLDAFDKGEVNVIAHCCNAQSKMESGIAKSIKERYPKVYYEYLEHLSISKDWSGGSLGTIHYVNLGEHPDGWRDKKVYNLIGQEFYGLDKRYVNYGALSQCLCAMSTGLTQRSELTVNDYDTIGFPFKMASDRAVS